MEAYSQGLEQGSEFVVYLPTVNPYPLLIMVQAVHPTSSRPRILIVDDNVDASLIVSLCLKQKGYSVQRGDSGLQALSIAECWLPQAILLDISMPGIDGYTACQSIRQQPWGHGMVIVALTGYGHDANRRQAQEAGFDGYLIKPADLDTLPSYLMELIDRKRADEAQKLGNHK